MLLEHLDGWTRFTWPDDSPARVRRVANVELKKNGNRFGPSVFSLWMLYNVRALISSVRLRLICLGLVVTFFIATARVGAHFV